MNNRNKKSKNIGVTYYNYLSSLFLFILISMKTLLKITNCELQM